MPKGYNGSILRVNLSDGSIGEEHPADHFYRRYFGGRALISYYLLRELEPDIDPLSAKNLLIFAAGVVTGVPVSGAGRNSLGAKSPLTGIYGDSEAGGYWGAELKRAGFDAIVVEGRSDKPVYLSVRDGEVELRDATHLWGKTTAEAQALIKEELDDPNVRVAQIGIAGESLVRFACVTNDLSHFYGRTGLGAVMGAKRLRAVAVRGARPIAVSDEGGLRALAKWVVQNRHLVADLHDTGTAGDVLPLNAAGGLPTRNFRETSFEGAELISGEMLRDSVLVQRGSCFACAVRCKRVVAAQEPLEIDPRYGGPEYETLAALGSNNGVSDLILICKANELCAAYGLDTISTGAVLSFARECFEAGILTLKDTDGLDISFGNAESTLSLLEMIAHRRGLGDLLAEGARRAAERLGTQAQKYAMHVKGQEVPMHSPRFKQGLGLGYALSPTGAEHETNMHDTDFCQDSSFLAMLHELGIFDPLPLHNLSAAKVRMYVYWVNWMHFLDCAGICHFPPFDFDRVVELVRVVTGWKTNLWELLKVGERAHNMARAFNVREGLGREADRLPDRFFEPLPSGPIAGMAIKEEAFEEALVTCYQMLGWDPERAAPTAAKLAELDIAWVADELAARGRLPERARLSKTT